jgi:ribosomal protein S18 acetylase RimI-like enzyme
MQLALRSVRDADQPFLLHLYASTRADELGALPWSPEQKAAFAAQQFAAQTAHYARQHPAIEADIILIEDVRAGRLLVARSAREILVVDISLLPEFRGRGAGSILLRRLMDEASSTGKRLSLHVERHNRALGLYERIGFRRVADHGVYLGMEWEPPETTARSATSCDTTTRP